MIGWEGGTFQMIGEFSTTHLHSLKLSSHPQQQQMNLSRCIQTFFFPPYDATNNEICSIYAGRKMTSSMVVLE